MRYANRPDVLVQLEISDVTENADAIARIERMENGIADAFDQKIGRSFGVIPVAQTRFVEIRRSTSHRLILPYGLRSLTSIAFGGEWDGMVWLDSETIPASEYRLILGDHDGTFWGIEWMGLDWSYRYGTLRVTGVWDDQVSEDVPSDVREAMNFLVVDEWRLQKTSPAGEIGPEGMTIQIRNPWTFDRVKAAINHHSYRSLVV